MTDNIIIDIFLDETDTPFARYYNADNFHLSSDLEDFIFSKLHNGRKRKVEILLKGQNNYEEKSLKTAISNTFSNRVKVDKYIYTRNNIKACILYVIGIIVGLTFLWLTSINAYIAGVLSIMCWVFLWAGTEIYFFDNREIKTDIRKCKNIINANVLKK